VWSRTIFEDSNIMLHIQRCQYENARTLNEAQSGKRN
jgi:hypothetical protein